MENPGRLSIHPLCYIPADPQRGLAEPVTDSLYRITGGDSNGLTYVSMWQLLVDHAAAGEEIAEKEPPF